MRKGLLYKIFTTVLLGCVLLQAKGQFEEGIEMPSVFGLPALTGSGLVDLANNTTTYTDQGETSRKITNIITFKIIEGGSVYFASNFSATAELALELTDADNNVTNQNITLTVQYDNTLGAKYHVRDYKVFKDFVKAKVTVTHITVTGNSGWDPKEVLEVENEMRTIRYFPLSTNISDLTPTLTVSQPLTDALHINWTFPPEAHENMTQLEWAYVEDEMLDYYDGNYEQIFQNNSTRIDLDYSANGYDYNIPLLYPGPGKLYYRARAVHRTSNGSLITGPWSVVSEAENAFTFEGHEDSLNWQSSTSFAEGGKYKSVIEYFDGSLRKRQTVTKDNSTGNTIVGETIYDLQGRPNIQILPTPTIGNAIKYFPDFDRFNGMQAGDDPARFFDLTPDAAKTCETPPPLDTNYGEGRYYSGNNDWLGSESKSQFIPDAHGYAYMETRFTDDATQRVMAQGGVGPDHQIGSGHETKYYYGKPSQPELDALFGTEAGDASHYFKNMVQDANGQMSVSYIDMHGRTIATALAGEAPQGLDSIINETDYPLAPGSVRNDLLTPATNIIQGKSVISVSTILAPAATSFHFTYKLNPEILHLINCNGDSICFDCKYDLEISVKGEGCGNDIPMIEHYHNLQLVPANESCGTSMGFIGEGITEPVTQIEFDADLSAGSYVVRKSLTINDSLYNIRRDSALKALLCQTQEQIFDSVYNVLSATSACGSSTLPEATCDSCLSNLGNFTTYRGKYLASISPLTVGDAEIHAQYSADSIECASSCGTGLNPQFSTLRGLRDQMLSDMIPFTGQYAIDSVNDQNGVIDLTRLEAKFTIFTNSYISNGVPVSTGKPFYNKPQSENGGLYYYTDDGIIDNTITPLIDTITRYPFAGIFQNSWAGSLIKYHPEYSKLHYAETTMKASYDWLDNMQNCNSYQTAVDSGFTVLVNESAGVIKDPYFLLSNTTADKDTIDHELYDGISYQGVAPTIWQMANSSVTCSTVDSAHKLNCIMETKADGMDPSISGDSEKDEVWEKFKSIYLSYRNEMVLRYINAHAPGALSQADMDTLIREGKQLTFARAQDVANQNGWTWWAGVTDPESTDTTGMGAYLASSGLNSCEGQRPFWKGRLLQCEQIRTLLDNNNLTDSNTVNIIINTILDSLVTICQNSVTPTQPYGASTVNPSYSGNPGSFEEVINNVFNANGIHTLPGNNYFCNPFTLDFPKPFGSNPPVSVNYTNTLDSCACNQFSALKREAASKDYDTLSFSSMNLFFEANYNDSLTLVLWSGLQNCSSLLSDTCHHHLGLSLESQPGGGDTVCANCTLNVYHRTDFGKPAAYVARCEINFLPDFQSDSIDNYEAFIDPDIPLCDSTCPAPVINSVQRDGGTTSFRISYTLTPGCDSCKIIMSDAGNNILDSISNICGTTDTLFTGNYDSTTCYNFVIKCNSQICGQQTSVTYIYRGCLLNHCIVYAPIILTDFVPLPPFFNCNYRKPCISCSTLVDILTPEFRTLYPDYSGVPYLDSAATDAQISQNALWARFLNFRTGFSRNALDYMTAYKNCSSQNPPSDALCALDKPANDPGDMYPVKADSCETVKTQARFITYRLFQTRKDSLIANFDSLYTAQCLGAKDIEEFYVMYKPKEYHYTLYYYDQAGNLVKTMPPSAVRPDYDATYLSAVITARHGGTDLTNSNNNEELATQYRYNSLDQVIAQSSPDGGVSKFWYDRLGRLVVSQNAVQAEDNQYSYTLYDELGRITEVGQKPQTSAMTQVISQSATALSDWIAAGGLKGQITRTVYDISYYAGEEPGMLEPTLYQRNLRNRVSYTQLIDEEPEDGIYTNVQSAATYYSYDILGNVDTVLQDLKGAMGSPNRYKKIVYDFDLISGKVNKVSYQPGIGDQFYHKYLYDDENRLVEVETSQDSIYWEKEAGYEYYRHGPLNRMVLGQNQVQGVDYAYTLQGWLKGVNSSAVLPLTGAPDHNFDIGGDGSTTSLVARDAFGFSLNYYNSSHGGDYTPIGTTAPNPFVWVTDNLPELTDGVSAGNNLFNGNIRAMLVNVPRLGIANLYGYRYDQLNRIKAMNRYTGLDSSINQFTNGNTPGVSQDYKERVTYDPNGNIRSYLRHANAERESMDNLAYTYKTNTNKLDKVADSSPDAASGEYDKYNDIRQGQSDGNYQYDAVGNLASDVSEGITDISWTVYGKIKTITKSDGTEINYGYDASGNRVDKKVTVDGLTKTTVYVRDASGNILSIYTEDPAVNSGHLTQSEIDIYGSSRLGTWNPGRDVSELGTIAYSDYISNFERGNKFFELSNHLGNVLATVSDKKIGHSTDGTTIDYYNAEVVSANDYYPFGMLMPGRKYSIANTNYRYGFNGKELDKETSSTTTYDYGFRIYSPALAKFLSIDPLIKKYPELTPYQFASNSPIVGVDLDGLEFYYAADGKFLGQIGTSQQVYTADKIEDKTRVVTDASGNKKIEKYQEAVNAKSLNIDHSKFQAASYVIMQEGLSQSSTEYLWIAHTNNNNAKASKKSFSSLLLGSYSSVKNKTALSDKNSSNRANYARAGVIDVLLGNADPTGGARFWDGIDFIAWGLNSPNGTPQNKFEDFKSLNISKDIYNTYLGNAKSFYPKGYNYQIGKDANGKKKYFHSDIPNGVFTDPINWSTGNFLYNTGVKNQPSLQATGTAGGTIFWKPIK